MSCHLRGGEEATEVGVEERGESPLIEYVLALKRTKKKNAARTWTEANFLRQAIDYHEGGKA